jgi:hypothetical protein
MAEVVGTFSGADLRDERANGSCEARNSSRGDFAQECLEFAVRQLDWIEVRRIFRQVANCRPGLLDRLPNAGPQVDPAVVHHHDIVAPKGWDQALLDIINSAERFNSGPAVRVGVARANAPQRPAIFSAILLTVRGQNREIATLRSRALVKRRSSPDISHK